MTRRVMINHAFFPPAPFEHSDFVLPLVAAQPGAGLTLRAVFRQQATKGSIALRPIADRISQDLERGESLRDALDKEKVHFPPLFLSLAGVGEKTGNLPEIFAELEKYYLVQQKLWRQFISQITWPMIQFYAAHLVISLLLLVLGILGGPFDPFGFGVGGPGAIRFLGGSIFIQALLVFTYVTLTRSLKHQAAVDRFLLNIPVLGPCLRALALTRFCIALRLTLETGMSIASALRLTMTATGNGAFIDSTSVVVRTLKRGDKLNLALTRTGLFPDDFLNIVASAEESGRVPEVMEHQTAYYEEEAVRKMKGLTSAVGGLIWMTIAGLLIYAIFKIYFTAVIAPIQELTKD